jgi:hypothetical protein
MQFVRYPLFKSNYSDGMPGRLGASFAESRLRIYRSPHSSSRLYKEKSRHKGGCLAVCQGHSIARSKVRKGTILAASSVVAEDTIIFDLGGYSSNKNQASIE